LTLHLIQVDERLVNASDLKIRSLRATPVNVPLARPHPTASGMVESAPLVLVDLETDQGLTGRCYVFCYTSIALKPITDLIDALLPLIQGDAVAPLVLAQKLQGRFRLLGPQGFTGIAIAGIDMAAWDLLAKSVDLSLTRLLGGEEKPIPAYHSLGMAGPDGAAREAAESIGLGFRCVKFKVGYQQVEQDRAVIRAARREGGKDLQVMVDYNQSLSVPDAIRRVQFLEEEALVWVEEPTRADDFAGHARIAAECRTPVQIGENLRGPHDLTKSISEGASDFIMLDVMKIGGISGWLRAIGQAEAAGLPVSSHLFPEISAQLLAVSPQAHWLEYQDWAAPILQRPLEVKDGFAIPQKEAGCGIVWDEDAVHRYRLR
jgi:mandelate racemase